MTSARVEAAARVDFNLSRGLDPDDRADWERASGETRALAVARAEVLLASVDAADDRIRLTMPQFNAIKADAISQLSLEFHMSWSEEQREAARVAGVQETLKSHLARLGRHREPVDHEEAMASLIVERIAAALRSTAESLDNASLGDVIGRMETPVGVSARYKRSIVSGCADWLRHRAGDLEAGGRVPYRRVNTQAVIDEDRHTALLGALGRVIRRSKRLQTLGKEGPAFIITDRLVKAIEETGATIPAED